jgi:hypothetical protein
MTNSDLIRDAFTCDLRTCFIDRNTHSLRLALKIRERSRRPRQPSRRVTAYREAGPGRAETQGPMSRRL